MLGQKDDNVSNNVYLIAVSYTHLDVYKRQVVRLCIERRANKNGRVRKMDNLIMYENAHRGYYLLLFLYFIQSYEQLYVRSWVTFDSQRDNVCTLCLFLFIVCTRSRGNSHTLALSDVRCGICSNVYICFYLCVGVPVLPINTPVSYTHLDVYKRQK